MFTRRCPREWRAEKIFGISHSFRRMPVGLILSHRSRSDAALWSIVFPRWGRVFLFHVCVCGILSVSRDVNCMQSCPARASLTPLAPVVYKECAFCNHIFGR